MSTIVKAITFFYVSGLVMMNFAVRAQKQVKPENNVLGCGYRNKRGAGNQVSGAQDGEAQFGEFPWMLIIFKQNPGTEKTYKCGASLIHPQVALTAAHCLDDNKTDTVFIVRAGGWDMELIVEILPFQDREVKEKIIHPNFEAVLLHNDIALLILESPFELAQHINSVCLPTQDSVVKPGRGLASGFGKNKVNDTVEYPVLEKKIDIPVISNDVCQEELRKTSTEPSFELHDSFMCAGGEPDKDTCQGDGGSPLVFPIGKEPDRYYQAGIVSWGIECWKNNTPGVYTNVAKFRNWIDEQMKNNKFEISAYQYRPTNE